MSAPTWQDLYDLGLYTLQARRPKLVVREGDVTDAMVAGCATMADVVVGYAAGRFRSTYLDGAEGQDLTEEARDRGVARAVERRQILELLGLDKDTAAAREYRRDGERPVRSARRT